MASPATIVLFSLALLSLQSWTSMGAGQISTYWGQNGYEGTLQEACDSGLYEYINLAFVVTLGRGRDLGLNLAGHCDPSSGGCTFLGSHIKHCQSKGVKVLISIGGASGDYILDSAQDAHNVAQQLWDSFLGGSSSNRFFGDAILDGVDFDIEGGTTLYWDELARELKAYSTEERKVYLSAAPQAPFPDAWMGNAINTGLFDYAWVQFYNNPWYEFRPDNVAVFKSTWTSWNNIDAEKVFLGLPASPNAASTGYIDPQVFIDEVLPIIKSESKYGGIMLWSRYYDVQDGFAEKVKPYL